MEQAPRSVFHQCDKSDTSFFVVFLDLLGAIKRVDPERYVSCESFELLVSNVNEAQIIIKQINFLFLSEISNNQFSFPFFSSSKQKR